MEDLSGANTTFALDLYKQLAKADTSKNIFFSPWSISAAAGMVYEGARGNTATQMAEVLHFPRVQGDESPREAIVPFDPCDMEQQVQKLDYHIPILKPGQSDTTSNILQGFQALYSVINKTNSNYLLRTANNLYGEQSYEFSKEYLKLIQTYYHAMPQAVNFATAAEDARKEINCWVENQTESKIKNLLPEGSVNSLTTLVLVNAVYFKGKWANTFQKSNTKEKRFRLSRTTSKPVQMMCKKDKCNIYQDDSLETMILDMPYVNNDLSMIILLPNDINDNSTGLEKLERALTLEKLLECTSPDVMEKVSVEVYLPKIKLEEKYDLRETLSLMGMSDVFSQEKANLSGMSTGNLYLSQVFHKAYVDINEEGTEAAAATGATVMRRSREITVKFEVDHPFLFFIKHNKTNTILFYGRCCSP
ncbi:serpin B10 [Microcaecilia unicolor]|uniref:Serpin B10-like n=1 Tax=Microcaecilia unicolor TaxID=1415580 RepID=A0A6P7YBZ5_9AMPH|nr:serpin B10-like [Microcaecilia unicolor]